MAGTVVLIHGPWVTALSWEHWVRRYTEQGLHVIARSWPGMEGDIDALRHDPSAIAALGISDVVDHYERIVRSLGRAPIIIGHSLGGLVAQILLDRGLGAAAVAIDSAPVKGTFAWPFSRPNVGGGASRQPAGHHGALALTLEQFHAAFTSNLSETASVPIFKRYAVPGPDPMLFQTSLANFNPYAVTTVNFHNDRRAPLLLVAGGKDRVVPAAVTKANFNLYKMSLAITDYKEFPDRSHYTVGEDAWEEVADYALTWAAGRTATRVPMQLTVH